MLLRIGQNRTMTCMEKNVTLISSHNESRPEGVSRVSLRADCETDVSTNFWNKVSQENSHPVKTV